MAAFYSVLEGDREEIEELIDIDSVVDAYIVEEVFKNLDAGWSSFYMYRDIGGKLFFGPVWDFDLTSGNADGKDMNPNFPSSSTCMPAAIISDIIRSTNGSYSL